MKNLEGKRLENVVFFDGVCGLCNAFVDFLIVRDRNKKLFFAPLQGQTFDSLMAGNLTSLPDSVVFYTGGKMYTRSTAAIKILTSLGGWYVLVGVFYLIPSSLRDAIYDFVASKRYAWFGKKETCRLPTKEERAQFLD